MSKSSLSHFFSNVLSSGLGKVSTVVFGILCMLVYARWMSQEEYGGFVLLQVLISLGLSFGELGMDTVTTRFIAGTEDIRERRKIINTGIIFRALSMVLICILIFLFDDNLYQLMGGKVPQLLLLYLPAFLFVEGLLDYYAYILQGLLKFKSLAIINFTYGLTSLILTVILVIPLDMGAHGLVWARLVPNILCLIISIMAVQSGFRFEFDLEWFKRLFKFGLPLYGNKLLAFAYSRADTFVIGYFFGPAEIAIYEFARRIPESIEMLYTSFVEVFFPYITNLFSSKQFERISNMVNHANRLTAFLGGLAVILSFGLGDWFFRVFFSEQYLPSVPPFIALMVVLIFIALDSNMGYTLVAIGEQEKPLFINIIRFGIVLGSYFILIPMFQVVGAVIASLIGLAVVNPLNVFFLRRKQVEVSISAYVKPLFLLSLGLALYFVYESNIIIDLVFLVMFTVISFNSGILRREDLQLFQAEAGKLITRFNRRFSHE